jgi:hypothetical protein
VEPVPFTKEDFARAAISQYFQTVTENLGGIKPIVIINKYVLIFGKFLPMLRNQRNELAHGYDHRAKSVNWPNVWYIIVPAFGGGDRGCNAGYDVLEYRDSRLR